MDSNPHNLIRIIPAKGSWILWNIWLWHKSGHDTAKTMKGAVWAACLIVLLCMSGKGIKSLNETPPSDLALRRRFFYVIFCKRDYRWRGRELFWTHRSRVWRVDRSDGHYSCRRMFSVRAEEKRRGRGKIRPVRHKAVGIFRYGYGARHGHFDDQNHRYAHGRKRYSFQYAFYLPDRLLVWFKKRTDDGGSLRFSTVDYQSLYYQHSPNAHRLYLCFRSFGAFRDFL